MPAPVRRIVTGHDAAGRAVVVRDDAIATVPVPTGDAEFALVWTTSRAPADNNGPVDGEVRQVGLSLAGGSVLRIVDMAPGCQSPMHRTRSLDYGIVLQGEIELVLDDGACTTVRAGEVVVQRGTIHAWANRTSEWCRIAFTLLDAELVSSGDGPLAPTH